MGFPRARAAAAVLAVAGLPACRGVQDWRFDPAQDSRRPDSFRDDRYDREAASVLERSGAVSVPRPLGSDRNEEAIVATAWESLLRAPEGTQLVPGLMPNGTPAGEVMIVRRPRASYALLAREMADPARGRRTLSLRTFEVLESRRRGGVQSDPPYRGPERDAALVAVEGLLGREPDPELRASAAFTAFDLLQRETRPSTAAVRAALESETNASAKTWLLWLYAARRPATSDLLAAATRGVGDPATVAVAIHHLFVGQNRRVLEDALRRGDPVGRAGIGEALYRHSALPSDAPLDWAEDLMLAGLADSEPEVRARFAKGVLRPPSPRVRARLEALASTGDPSAATALKLVDRPRDSSSPPAR